MARDVKLCVSNKAGLLAYKVAPDILQPPLIFHLVEQNALSYLESADIGSVDRSNLVNQINKITGDTITHTLWRNNGLRTLIDLLRLGANIRQKNHHGHSSDSMLNQKGHTLLIALYLARYLQCVEQLISDYDEDFLQGLNLP